jgi:hypothetical protein
MIYGYARVSIGKKSIVPNWEAAAGQVAAGQVAAKYSP